ncbi:MAG: citrate synthase, partial [Patescibacteria group bacterium]
MDPLKKKFADKSAALKTQMKALLKEKGTTKVDEVTLSQVFGGMRGVKSMIWETSHLDPIDGIRFRGYS